MELLQLFITASVPVLKVLLITALGSYLALDSVDILGEDARKHLNTVSFLLFLCRFTSICDQTIKMERHTNLYISNALLPVS